MYFVTIRQPGYCLFSMTPSERMAVALVDDQTHVHVLERRGDDWTLHQEFPVATHSHTDLMHRLADVDEPATVTDLVRIATGR